MHISTYTRTNRACMVKCGHLERHARQENPHNQIKRRKKRVKPAVLVAGRRRAKPYIHERGECDGDCVSAD